MVWISWRSARPWAGRWSERAGAMADAVRHALAGEDAARAADLVELAAPGLRRTRQDKLILTK